jgi:hypothetical protein
MIVVAPPEIKLPSRVGQVEEDLHVQALIPQLALEALDVPVLNGLARPDEVRVYAVPVSPQIKRLARKLSPIVDRDRLRSARKATTLFKAIATFSLLSVLSAHSVRHSRVN